MRLCIVGYGGTASAVVGAAHDAGHTISYVLTDCPDQAVLAEADGHHVVVNNGDRIAFDGVDLVVFPNASDRLLVLEALRAGRHVAVGRLELVPVDEIIICQRTAQLHMVWFGCLPWIEWMVRSMDVTGDRTVTLGDGSAHHTTHEITSALSVALVAACPDYGYTTVRRIDETTLEASTTQGSTCRAHWDTHAVAVHGNVHVMGKGPDMTVRVMCEATFRAMWRRLLDTLPCDPCRLEERIRAGYIASAVPVVCDMSTRIDYPRTYSIETSPAACVRLYRDQRVNQTYWLAGDLAMHYGQGGHFCMTMWDALQSLRVMVDSSDPDMALPNDAHALQTAELMWRDGLPESMVAMGLVHDVGKILYRMGNDVDGTSLATQWAVVGDTFVTGWPIPSSVPFPMFNRLNSDHEVGLRAYQPHCGLSKVRCSFGHDEFLYRALVRNRHLHSLDDDSMTIIRFHSLYAWHSYDAYSELEDAADVAIKPYVRLFQAYDLYSKSDCLDNLSWEDPKWRALVERVFSDQEWDW